MRLGYRTEWYGECVFTRHADGTVTIDHADPRIRISAELLTLIADSAEPDITLAGDVLTIHGTDRKVIYRIGEHLTALDFYVAEWPD